MKLKENISLRDYSTFRVGGNTKYFAVIEKKDDLVKFIYKIDMPFRILGGGSNTFIDEEYFNGLTIVFKTSKPEILVKDKGCSGLIYVEASVPLSFLVALN